ncbi:hypothetical protein KIN20_031399 [Parelaphostrongylus tenuis]|uniref:Uncharacterized protein n=1 Tax=Parelaphostrongylus tenuis TaxID=148309 RepID=A0AAD5R5I6_PARTN|nr:hypothetical protein KIN20_031399 [Parelaphostrongylus tenuis]
MTFARLRSRSLQQLHLLTPRSKIWDLGIKISVKLMMKMKTSVPVKGKKATNGKTVEADHEEETDSEDQDEEYEDEDVEMDDEDEESDDDESSPNAAKKLVAPRQKQAVSLKKNVVEDSDSEEEEEEEDDDDDDEEMKQ